MLNFLKAKKPELTVTLDRPNGIYYPGETVGVTVEVQPGKDLKVQGAHVTLSGIEEYKYRTRRHSTDSDGNTSDDYDRLEAQRDLCKRGKFPRRDDAARRHASALFFPDEPARRGAAQLCRRDCARPLASRRQIGSPPTGGPAHRS